MRLPTAVAALYCSAPAITFRRANHAVETNLSAMICHDYDNSRVRRQWLLSSPYITFLDNYAVTEVANKACLALFCACLFLHGNYAQERGMAWLLRWLSCVEQSWIRSQRCDSTLLDKVNWTDALSWDEVSREQSRRPRSVLAKNLYLTFTFSSGWMTPSLMSSPSAETTAWVQCATPN